MSGRIKDEDVAYIRDRAPIDEVVADYVQLKNAGGGQKKGLCPFHDEKITIISCNTKQGLLSLLRLPNWW
jgi:DNA primase